MKRKELPPVTAKAFSHSYYGHREDFYFTNVLTGEKRLLVTKEGHLAHFPGIEDHPEEDREDREYIAGYRRNPRSGYDLRFEPFGKENYIVFWMIRPDGRYWEDEDGFGGTSDEEIKLYALLDRTGHYIGPFRLQGIGTACYAWDYDNLYLRFRKDHIAGDGSRLVDTVDHQYEKGKEPPIRKVNTNRVSSWQIGEIFRYRGKKYADITALKEDIKGEEKRRRPAFNRTVMMEFQEPISPCDADDVSNVCRNAGTKRTRHRIYLICRGQMDCLSYEDGGKEITVTQDVDRVSAFIWKEMVRVGFTREEEICVVSANYPVLCMTRNKALFWTM